MDRKKLVQEIKNKRSYLCIGLDTDIEKIPAFLRDSDDPVYEFNKRIIDATSGLCVAYKLNLAFYEALGAAGLQSLQKTVNAIPANIFKIADAKRGDIGNTSELYAKAFFRHYNFDAVTLSPYMGADSVAPFLAYENKWAIILAVTSNSGALDFQFLPVDGELLYGKVISKASTWGTENNIMFVVGATQSSLLGDVRKMVPSHFLLIPGVGAQGGNLEEVSKLGMNSDCGILVNSARQIIYAGSDHDFDEQARTAASALQQEMEKHLRKYSSLL